MKIVQKTFQPLLPVMSEPPPGVGIELRNELQQLGMEKIEGIARIALRTAAESRGESVRARPRH